MSQNTIRVVAHVTASSDQIGPVKQALSELVEPTRQETGCLQYNLYQNQNDPTDFTFVEEWANADALDNHLLSEHIQIVIQKLDGLLATPPDIRRYNCLF